MDNKNGIWHVTDISQERVKEAPKSNNTSPKSSGSGSSGIGDVLLAIASLVVVIPIGFAIGGILVSCAPVLIVIFVLYCIFSGN